MRIQTYKYLRLYMYYEKFIMNIVKMMVYILAYFDIFVLKVKLVLGEFCKNQTFIMQFFISDCVKSCVKCTDVINIPISFQVNSICPNIHGDQQ